MTMIPRLLKAGDKIGIVAPSRVIDRAQMHAAYATFKAWGLEVIDGDFLYNQSGYFAGTDEERLKDLQHFIDDENVKAVFCARGGYGLTRIVDKLNFQPLFKKPKWFVGFSDITALHIALNRQKFLSIHGLMPVQFSYENTEASIQSLFNVLFKGDGHVEVPPHTLNCLGHARGELIGGNLSLVAESLGTPTEIDTDGKVLFLEEIDEYLYKIDRMLTQLRRAGKLSKLKGLIIGDFTDMKDTQIKFGTEIDKLIASHVRAYDYPVAFNFPIGHESLNLAVPVSGIVDFSVKKDSASLSFNIYENS